jgi:hypothetical protein
MRRVHSKSARISPSPRTQVAGGDSLGLIPHAALRIVHQNLSNLGTAATASAAVDEQRRRGRIEGHNAAVVKHGVHSAQKLMTRICALREHSSIHEHTDAVSGWRSLQLGVNRTLSRTAIHIRVSTYIRKTPDRHVAVAGADSRAVCDSSVNLVSRPCSIPPPIARRAYSLGTTMS